VDGGGGFVRLLLLGFFGQLIPIESNRSSAVSAAAPFFFPLFIPSLNCSKSFF
jgi:hypothetical protein